MKPSHCYDVVIVGAGASGLSCASTLLKQNADLLVLEARDRIGGRVLSRKSSRSSRAVELGAEFIHAASPLVLQLLQTVGQDFYDAQFEQLFLKNGKMVVQKDFWERFEKTLALAKDDRKKDRSMADFIRAHSTVIPNDMKELLIGYVEGFQGADLNLIGEKSFASSEKGKRDLNGNNDFRPLGAYSDVITGLLKGNDLRRKIRLKHVVRRIRWQSDQAEIITTSPSGRTRRFFAKQVVLSVPLGVLRGLHKKSEICIEPEIPEIESSLRTLHVGHVQRIVFVFKTRFWESLSEDKAFSFMRAGPDHYFPTWWNLNPLRAPYLIAWQGGPFAQEMAEWTQEERIETALRTLAQMTRRSLRFLKEQLVSAHHHNWSTDPFSLGGYSYTGIQTEEDKADRRLHLKKFLWLTGEAFAKADGQGTVHGALEHGQATAEKILRYLK